ncbi:MAG TPA: menaquinone biosynthesis protein [Planctomycetota bacterium]
MIRVGCVPYLCSKVLIHGLQPETAQYTLELDVPSSLVRRLRDGSLDIALVSSIEYFRDPGYCILPDLSISGHREMWSLKLFHRGPLKAARRLGLDPASETTNALLQIVLQDKLQLGVELVPLSFEEDPVKRPDLDGFLKIGDACLCFAPPPEYETMDLVAEWYSFTSLPFVSAVWVARKGIDLESVNAALFMAKREGLRHVDEIARQAAPRLGLDYLRARNYILRVVHYDLGRYELGGLDLFRRYLIRQGLVPHGAGFDFYTR